MNCGSGSGQIAESGAENCQLEPSSFLIFPNSSIVHQKPVPVPGTSSVPMGDAQDAQDARASPPPPPVQNVHPPPGHVLPLSPQPERLVMRKDEAVQWATRKK
jgi:hypothetical protein